MMLKYRHYYRSEIGFSHGSPEKYVSRTGFGEILRLYVIWLVSVRPEVLLPYTASDILLQHTGYTNGLRKEMEESIDIF